MAREISSGGVVVREISGTWHVALIEPQRDNAESSGSPKKRKEAPLALPKGLVDPGETPEVTSVREVREETGICGQIITKLTDIKYVYVRSWGDGERVFKVVSFYLLQYSSGEIDALAPEMRIEVKRATWVPLQEASRRLGYSNERKVIRLAEEYIQSHETVIRALARKPG